MLCLVSWKSFQRARIGKRLWATRRWLGNSDRGSPIHERNPDDCLMPCGRMKGPDL